MTVVYLVVLALASIVVTIMWRTYKGRYRLDTLALILWASTIMFTVDKAYAYIVEGEEFLSLDSESLLLGIVLVVSAIALWVLAIVFSRKH